MPTPSITKLANVSAAAVNPVPEIMVPDMPEKLRRIDPDGCDKFIEDLRRGLNDFRQKLNTTQLGVNQAVLNLQRK